MLLGGDEIGRTQHGNNNAYCQDNEISWFNWDIGETGDDSAQLRPRRHRGHAGQPHPATPGLLHRRAASPACETEGRHLDPARRHGDDGAGLGGSRTARHRHAPARVGRPTRSTSRGRSSAGDSLFLHAQRRDPLALLPAPPDGAAPDMWEEVLNTAQPGPWSRIVRNEAVSLIAHSTLAAAPHRTPPRMSRGPTRSAPPIGCSSTALGFGGRTALVPYLHALGIETLYVSPVLAAAPGSTHGYDVIDPTRLDPALGSRRGVRRPCSTPSASHGMRLLLDIVPNHMAADPANALVVGHAPPGQDLRCAASSISTGPSTEAGSCFRSSAVPSPTCSPRDRPSRDPESGTLVRATGSSSPSRRGSAGQAAAGAARHHSISGRPSGGSATPPGTTGGSSTSTASSGSASKIPTSSPGPTTYIPCSAPTCGSPASASTTSTACRTRGISRSAPRGPRRRRTGRRPVVLVEKILDHDEVLDGRWLVDGTTGYEFADRALWSLPRGLAARLCPSSGRR